MQLCLLLKIDYLRHELLEIMEKHTRKKCMVGKMATFNYVIEDIIQDTVEIPERLQEFMKGRKQSIALGKDFQGFKDYLMNKTV